MVFILSFNFIVTQYCPAWLQTFGQRRDLYSVTLDNAIFWWGGSHVWPHFSQLFFLKIGEFLYSSERKYPEFSKTPQFLSIAHFWCPLWPFERGSPFFWTPCMLTYDLCRHLPVTPIKPKRGIPTASTITRKLSSVPFVIGVSLISDWWNIFQALYKRGRGHSRHTLRLDKRKQTRCKMKLTVQLICSNTYTGCPKKKRSFTFDRP